MLFNRPATLVFIDTQSTLEPTEEMLDIVLSPAFYWCKRLSLPVKYLREVKQLLPSIFEETLPEGTYSYTAYSDGDDYVAFAYSDKMILDMLAQKGVKSSQINRVYFAQSEFDTLDTAVKLDDSAVMMAEKGVVIKVPSALTASAAAMNLEGHKLSRNNIELARYAHIADRKSLMLFASFMVVLTLLYTSEWLIVASKTSKISVEQSGVYAEHGLKSTRLQNEAVLKKLEKRYERQMALRAVSAKLLGVRLLKDEKIHSFERKGNSVYVSYAVASQKRANALKKGLAKEGMTIKDSYKKGILQLEVSL